MALPLSGPWRHVAPVQLVWPSPTKVLNLTRMHVSYVEATPSLRGAKNNDHVIFTCTYFIVALHVRPDLLTPRPDNTTLVTTKSCGFPFFPLQNALPCRRRNRSALLRGPPCTPRPTHLRTHLASLSRGACPSTSDMARCFSTPQTFTS